jgi:hypothetical protein
MTGNNFLKTSLPGPGETLRREMLTDFHSFGVNHKGSGFFFRIITYDPAEP